MADETPRHGHGVPLDLDSVIASTPETERAASRAEIAASIGAMVRRMRTRMGMTQAELARRTGATQAHLSELERGLGANGPTIATLNRVIQELGDTLVVQAAQDRIAEEEKLTSEARSGMAQLAARAVARCRAGAYPTAALAGALGECVAESRAAGNPFRRAMDDGFAAGVRLALQVMGSASQPGTAREPTVGSDCVAIDTTLVRKYGYPIGPGGKVGFKETMFPCVYNSAGEEIGSLVDVLPNKRSGNAGYVVVDIAEPAGGDNAFAIAWNRLTYDTERGVFVADLDRRNLMNAPTLGAKAYREWLEDVGKTRKTPAALRILGYTDRS